MDKKAPLAGKIEQKSPFFFPLVFMAIAFISALGLDYMSLKKGEKSYVFGAFPKKEKVITEEKTLDQIVRDNLSQHGIPEDAINPYVDTKGISHILIDLLLSQYKKVESSLEDDLRRTKVSVSKKEERKTDEKDFYLWEIKGKKKQKVILLFSCLKEKVAGKKPPIIEARGKVAIIIDDMGYSLNAIREIISLKRPLTVSVLPFSPYARETAQIARQNGLEIMLHLPLEAIHNQEGNNGTEGIIRSEMTESEVIQTLDRSLKQVPYIRGVNNHMGSKITTDVTFMRIILERLKERELFFIDSRTTSDSVAYYVAQILGIPSASRNIFLDTKMDEDSIRKKLIDLFRLAQKRGQATAIGHPTPQTLKVLKENLHLLDKYNLEPVFASQIVHQ
ncbi:MAG: divergent polysaccharide deacetylase family protein [Candidatus Aminicenantales bacterium]